MNEPGRLCDLNSLGSSSVTRHLKPTPIIVMFPTRSSRLCAITTCQDIKQISSSGGVFEPVLPARLVGRAQAAGAASAPTSGTAAARIWLCKQHFRAWQAPKSFSPPCSMSPALFGSFGDLHVAFCSPGSPKFGASWPHLMRALLWGTANRTASIKV